MRRMPGWISREERRGVLLSGSVELADGRQIAASVTDVSRQGCRVQSDETLRIGDRLILHVAPFDQVAATVRWSLFGTAGVRFDYDEM